MNLHASKIGKVLPISLTNNSTVRFSLLKLVQFSFLFFSYLLLVFVTPVNIDYQ